MMGMMVRWVPVLADVLILEGRHTVFILLVLSTVPDVVSS